MQVHSHYHFHIRSMVLLVKRALLLNLCPKARIENIDEFQSIHRLFLAARRNDVNHVLDLASLYLVARGIRGREGVNVLFDFCESQQFQMEWQNDTFIDKFVTFFEEKWDCAVQFSGVVSALSHQEGRHAAFSGMHFVETLKHPTHRDRLFKCVAVRLAPFFAEPQKMSSDFLMDVYRCLVSEPFALTSETYDVHRRGCGLLGKVPKIDAQDKKSYIPMVRDNSYNSMDFLRCYYHIMQLYKAPRIFFSEALWKKC